MNNSNDKMFQLSQKLETLLARQEEFSREIRIIQEEMKSLKIEQFKHEDEKEGSQKGKITTETKPLESPEKIPQKVETIQKQAAEKPQVQSAKKPLIKSDLEKFIGENLINKIGIAITVIGVAIGAKYSIDHDLISPLTRIILGYLAGLGLLGFGIKLKEKYKNFSAVLVSGSMTVMYFITYAAYSFYDIIPQSLAFILMVLFTAFTVIASLHYNKQVIAIIGMVGAYAVPLLLSEGEGRAAVLFSYMAIINVGILFIAFKKSWKLLYNLAFIFTWFIYFLWFDSKYETTEHFGLALVFISIFFVSFYVIFLAYKINQSKKLASEDVLLALANSFIFYGIGYSILQNHEFGEQLLGLFTLINAIVHFIVSATIYKKKLGEKNLFYLVSGLVMVFLTIAIPVQLDGNWVTLLWAGEALLLFWIGRTRDIAVYEKLSYPLMILAFGSILHDWGNVYGEYDPDIPGSRITFLLNTNFLSSLLFIAAFSWINKINYDKKYTSPYVKQQDVVKLFSFIISAILLVSIFSTFILEIKNYWSQLYSDSLIRVAVEGQDYNSTYLDSDLIRFGNIWMLNFALFYAAILTIINYIKFKNKNLGLVNLGLNLLVIIFFLLFGLYQLSSLRDSYLNQTLAEYYDRGIFNILFRYISFVFVTSLLISNYKLVHAQFMQKNLTKYFDYFLHFTILCIVSSELISWMEVAESSGSTKLGLSILWGIYSLFLIVLGIWKNKKHLRLSAIVLFTVTLCKLFFYDLSHLDTISKTIIFIILGVLLLIISFFYNKYKQVIEDEQNN